MLTENWSDVEYVFRSRFDLCDGLRAKKIIFSRKWDTLTDYKLFHIFIESFGFMDQYVKYLARHNLAGQLIDYGKNVNKTAAHVIVGGIIDELGPRKSENLVERIIKELKSVGDHSLVKMALKQRCMDHMAKFLD